LGKIPTGENAWGGAAGKALKRIVEVHQEIGNGCKKGRKPRAKKSPKKVSPKTDVALLDIECVEQAAEIENLKERLKVLKEHAVKVSLERKGLVDTVEEQKATIAAQQATINSQQATIAAQQAAIFEMDSALTI